MGLTSMLPEVCHEEALETTKVDSTTGLLSEKGFFEAKRPFWAPHHPISPAGFGGGQVSRSGEVSLAHNHALFSDELPEFRKNVPEVMRQPLWVNLVTIPGVNLFTVSGALHTGCRHEALSPEFSFEVPYNTCPI